MPHLQRAEVSEEIEELRAKIRSLELDKVSLRLQLEQAYSLNDNLLKRSSTMPRVTEVICIYHHPSRKGGCLDGSAAAWVVRKAYPSAILIPSDYGNTPPLDQIGPDDTVFIVDFSYPPEELKRIEDACRRIVVIDHHVTAIKKLKDYRVGAYSAMILNPFRSGCTLTWDYLYPGRRPPAWLAAAGAGDIWDFSNSNTKPICAYCYSRKPLTVEWLDEIDGIHPDTILLRGEVVLEEQEAEWKEAINSRATFSTIQGYNIPTIQLFPDDDASNILNIMAKGHPFSLGIYKYKDYTEYSFRSAKGEPQSINVSKLAEAMGGGGHVHAAGAKVAKETTLNDACPICGASLKFLAGEPAHPDNRYCSSPICHYEAWTARQRGA